MKRLLQRVPLVLPATATRAILAVTVAVIFISLNFPAVASSAGDLDPSFGGDGKVITSFLYEFQMVKAIAVQPDGKVVAAGLAGHNPKDEDFALARYNGDGTLDNSFGTDGRVITDFFGKSDGISGICLLPNGQILAAGWAFISESFGNFAIARYNSNGMLDTNFGSGGKVVTGFFGADCGADTPAVLHDGKILIAGWAYNPDYTDSDWALVRYNADGTLDASFGDNGRVLTEMPGDGYITSLGTQSNGKIIAGGLAWGNDWDFALTRYKASGKLDNSFGTDGKVLTDFSGQADTLSGLGIQSDDKIVTAGVSVVSGTSQFALARFNPNGTLDPSFGSEGRVITEFGNSLSVASAITIQSNGKILAAGTAGGADFALARYNPDGSLDTTFGTGGKVRTDFLNSSDQCFAATLAPDGRIILGGYAHTPRAGDAFAVACYLAKGTPNITNALVSGKKLFVFGANFDEGSSIYLDGMEQATKNDADNPETILIAKKAGKRIAPGQTVMLQVKCSDGSLSSQYSFTRPLE